MAQAAPPTTGFDFDHASLNLAPQQPSRVRRAWERVPTKAAQRKDRTVWKRADPKPLQYETEQGGTGFAVQGTKRLRTKNVPAFPVKAGRSLDREQEAEATDDELFSRRRKSGRRSSINPARKLVVSPKSRLISAPRPSRLSANPLRSPFKNLRVMELSHSPGGNGKRARPSIGGILGNGTPMRNAFTEPFWQNRSPSRVPLSPKNDLSAQKASAAPMTSPPRPFSARKELSHQKTFTPQKVFSQQTFPSFGASAIPFSPQMNTTINTPSVANAVPQETSINFGSRADEFGAPEAHQPRRRSARLSNSGISQEDLAEQPAATQQSSVDGHAVTEPTGSLWLAAPETQTNLTISLEDRTSPERSGTEESIKMLQDEIDEPSLQLQAELGAPLSPAKIALFPKQGKADLGDDEDQTQLFNNINATFEAKDTPERISSPRKRSPEKLGAFGSPLKLQKSSPELASPEPVIMHQDEEQLDEADVDCEVEEASEDELTARLEDWTDPAIMSPDEPEPKAVPSRNAPRFSDDTTILKAFLSRAQAKRDAQALTAATKPSARVSPRRSPRRALETVDGNSPSQATSPQKTTAKFPTKTDQKARIGNTPPSKPTMMLSFDADESDELASPVKMIRRSARPKPLTHSSKLAPSLIPLRRPDGQEPPRLRKTEAQELAIVTRSNTRRNRGQAQMPLFVLQDLSARELSPVKSRPSLPGSKSVDWNAELIEYLGEGSKRKTKTATATTVATTTTMTAAATATQQQHQQQIPQPKAKAAGATKRTKGLGTANGTPARARAARTALRPEANGTIGGSGATASSSLASAAGATPARPRPRRA